MRLRLPAPTYKKIGSGSGAAIKKAAPGGSGSATLSSLIDLCHLLLHFFTHLADKSKSVQCSVSDPDPDSGGLLDPGA